MPRAKTPNTTTTRKPRKKANSELPAVEFNINLQPAFDLDEEIRRRAYELYLARGGPGNPHEDWLRAEQQVRQLAQQAKV